MHNYYEINKKNSEEVYGTNLTDEEDIKYCSVVRTLLMFIYNDLWTVGLITLANTS